MPNLLNRKNNWFVVFTYLLLSCNEESFCKKHELEINNKIQVLVDSCLPSKYDEYKYIVELAVINKSSGGYLLCCRRKLIINGLLLQNHTG